MGNTYLLNRIYLFNYYVYNFHGGGWSGLVVCVVHGKGTTERLPSAYL